MTFQNENIEGHFEAIFAVEGSKTVVTFIERVKTPKGIKRFLIKPYLKRQQKQYCRNLHHVLGN